jgi:hypothetical protein
VLDKIQKHFGVPFTYEEMPFQNDADLPVRNNVDMGGGKYKLFVGPPISNLTLTISGGSQPYGAALAILSAYQAAKLPGVYKAIQQPSRIDIVPSQVLNRAGQWVQVTPLMSRLVNLNIQTRTVEDFFQAVVSQVSLQSGMNLKLLAQPFVRGEQTQMGAINESAADVISSIGDSMKTKLAFSCLYDATNNVYYLRIIPKPFAHVLPVASQSNPANVPKSLIDQSKPSHDNNPYFVKDQ